jgi:hypothetical protein
MNRTDYLQTREGQAWASHIRRYRRISLHVRGELESKNSAAQRCGPVLVPIVIGEYLACEVIWAKRTELRKISPARFPSKKKGNPMKGCP